MAGTGRPDRPMHMTTFPDLPEAECRADIRFTTVSARHVMTMLELVDICRSCRELAACRRAFTDYKTTWEWQIAGFTGVWAGQRFAKGRPVRT